MHYYCVCGKYVSIGESPCKWGYCVYPEKVLADIMENIGELYKRCKTVGEFEAKVSHELLGATRVNWQMYECVACGRLALFRVPSDKDPLMWYKQEELIGKDVVRLQQVESN